MSNGRFDEWALHAFVDGEVSDDQRDEIHAYLRDHPEEAARVADWEEQRRMLHRSFDGVAEEPIPSALLATARRGGGWRGKPFSMMAAALVLLMLGGLAGWFLAQETGGSLAGNIAQNALAAHRVYTAEVRHPVEVQGSERAHLQSWLSKRIGTEFVVPDLTAQGYTLLGGRLLITGERPAALLMFEDSGRKRITIYLTSQPENTETAIRVQRKGPLIACYWLDGKLGFVVSGEMDREPMMKLADIIYEQLEG